MAWELEGTVVIACNCDYGCPCNFNALPTYRNCEGGWIWRVERGRFDGVALDGLSLSLFCDWPGAIHERHGTAVALVDERADDAQREALQELVTGASGGPWGIFATTFDTLHGPYPAAYSIELAGHATSVRIDGRVELELEPIKNPVTGAETYPGMVLPEGLVVSEGSLAASKTFRVTGEIEYDHSGQYAAFGPFSYKGP